MHIKFSTSVLLIFLVTACTQKSSVTTESPVTSPTASPVPITSSSSSAKTTASSQSSASFGAEIDAMVKAYAQKEGFTCNEITSRRPNEHSSPESPKIVVECDGGQSKFVWVRYTTGETNVLPLL